MDIASLLLAAAAVLPVQAPPQRPEMALVPQGQSITCAAVGGCYITNAEGLDEIVRDVARQVTERCSRRAPAFGV